MDFSKLTPKEAKLALPEDKINESLDIISKMFELSKNPYIALSFGKDSLVMFDLINKIKPEVKSLFLKSEESFLLHNFEDVIDWYKKNKALNLHIVETNRLTESNFDWNKARKLGNKDFYLEDFFNGFDGFFMGIRIQESKARRLTLTQKKNNQIYKFIMQYKTGKRQGMYRCCPVAKWTADEIMLYLVANELKFLDIYNLGSHIRTTARLTGMSVFNHSLFYIRKNNPDKWKKIIELIPMLKEYQNFV